MSWKFEKEKIDKFSYCVSPKIHSIADYLTCINENWKEWKFGANLDPQEESPWFRGCEKAIYELIPGIYRGIDILGWDFNEMDGAGDAEDMKAEFARRAYPFLKNAQPFREGEYLHLMQHYRYPTRLLDWTEGALIALYFAIRAVDTPGRIDNPFVWMLNPSWLNYVNEAVNKAAPKNSERSKVKSLVLYTDYWARKQYEEDGIIVDQYLQREDRLSVKDPIAIFPPHIDPRIIAQRSVFTIHGTERNGFWELIKRFPDDAQFAKILITGDKDEIKEIKKNLKMSGITETTLFPDLEGLSREIQEEYDMKVKYP
jgi:hypothetical protein